MTEMTKKEIWKDLRKQVKVARADRNTKQAAITKSDWEKVDKSCIRYFQVQSIGIPNENQSSSDYTLHYCDDFKKGCEDKTCPMRKQYEEYQEAEAVLQGLKRARNKAFWDMFIRSK